MNEACVTLNINLPGHLGCDSHMCLWTSQVFPFFVYTFFGQTPCIVINFVFCSLGIPVFVVWLMSLTGLT